MGGPFLLSDLPRRSLWSAGQGVLYFAANDLHAGFELWRSDGGRLLFQAWNRLTGSELWSLVED